MIKVIGKREIFDIAVMFLVVQLLGLIVIVLLQNTSTLSILRSQIVSQSSLTLSYIIDAILVFVILLLFLNRHRRHTILVHNNAEHSASPKGQHITHHHLEDSLIYGTLEAAVVVATSFFFFLAIFDILLPQSFLPDIFFISLAAAIFLIAAKDLDHRIRNAVTIISSIGIGILLGLYFSFEFALIALAVVSVYDYISVFITKSMIKLANAISRNDMSLMISTSHLESVPVGNFPRKEVDNYRRYLHQIHEDENPKYEHLLRLGRLPVISQLQLGEGDLGLPLMVVISAFLTYSNYIVALSVVLGGTIGLLAAIRILKKYKHALPAIPPLFAFISIFVGTSLILTGTITASSYNPVILILIGFAVISFGMVVRYVSHRERAEARSTGNVLLKIP